MTEGSSPSPCSFFFLLFFSLVLRRTIMCAKVPMSEVCGAHGYRAVTCWAAGSGQREVGVGRGWTDKAFVSA